MNIKVKHFHPGNSTEQERDGHPYVTIAVALDEYDEVIARAEACCSKKDNPNRKRGREIAVGRLVKELYNVK